MFIKINKVETMKICCRRCEGKEEEKRILEEGGVPNKLFGEAVWSRRSRSNEISYPPKGNNSTNPLHFPLIGETPGKQN